MAYQNTRIYRYKEDGKVWDGIFIEQSRTEIAREDIVRATLIAEGYSEEEATEVATILSNNELV